MKSSNYRPINVPLRLHLEYEQITVGELSNILRHWQALLRTAWRESFQLQYADKVPIGVPTTRVLTVAATTENSFDLLSNFAIQAFIIGNIAVGPVVTWPDIVRGSYRYLSAVWERDSAEKYARETERLVFIKGGDTPELLVPLEALANRETGERLERLLAILAGGEITGTIEEESDNLDE